MKYLVCHTHRQQESLLKSVTVVKREEFDNFADAAAQYLLRCSTGHHVLLADLESQTILRQYAHAAQYPDANSDHCSDALYIY